MIRPMAPRTRKDKVSAKVHVCWFSDELRSSFCMCVLCILLLCMSIHTALCAVVVYREHCEWHAPSSMRHISLPSPGPSPSVSPPASHPGVASSRSLSEAHFNALRLEYQEYIQALEATGSRQTCLTPEPESDSDASSALL